MNPELLKARHELSAVGYCVESVLAVRGPWVVYTDWCPGLRISRTDRPFAGLGGGFYDNHNGHGETALEAALAAVDRIMARG